MALLELPNELLGLIIHHAIPEGFESLCLACRRLHTLCKPFITQHNIFRSHFRKFNYYEKIADPSFTIRTSFELIARIAEEPVVARYIEHADFKMDLRLPVGNRLWLMEDSGYRPETVRDLLSRSPYLSGTDWEDYFEKYERDLEDNRYCQAAAAFLLTLLPNVKTVVLPQRWKFDENTEKLLQAVVNRARPTHSPLLEPSLSSLLSLRTSSSLVERPGFGLDKITPLLSLPRIRSFHGPSSMSYIGMREPTFSYQSLSPTVSDTMKIAHLRSSNLDGPAMEHFLRCTPCLKTLVYSHSSKQLDSAWNICALVTAVVKGAGSHLEELSITKHDFSGKITFGTANLRNFARLQKLEIPLDLATCVIGSAAQAEMQESIRFEDAATIDQSHVDLLMCGLVPTTVSRLFLRSDNWEHRDDGHDPAELLEVCFRDSEFEATPQQHQQSLRVMFQGFAEKKHQLPFLREIRLSFPGTPSESFRAQSEDLLSMAGEAGVTVYLD